VTTDQLSMEGSNTPEESAPEKTQAEQITEAKETMSNSKKIEEIIDKFKKDKSILPNIIQMFDEDQQLRRNADNIARMVAPTGTMGQEVPLAQRKKLAQKQGMLRSLAKHVYTPGDMSCIVINKNGKVMSHVFNMNDINNDKWVLNPIVLNGVPFIAVCNSHMTSSSDKNKTATKLLSMPVNGPVVFLMMNEDYEITNMTPQEFKELSGL